MRRLPYEDASFDIVFSFSSIEHVYTLRPRGFLTAAARSMREMARVSRGVVVIATELCLTGICHYDWISGVFPMRNFFLPDEIYEYIVKPAEEVHLDIHPRIHCQTFHC